MLRDVERFSGKYIPVTESGCWLWTDATDKDGYAVFNARELKRQVKAHRYSYELHRGPIPEGLTIDHLCRVRCCINPDHLEPVTNKINVLRGGGWAAMNAGKTHCKRGHQFSDENTLKMKFGRGCRQCRNDQQARYYYMGKAYRRSL